MTVTTGPQDLVDAAARARTTLATVGSTTGSGGSREEWAAALAELQAVIDTASALQDDAIVRLAAIEPEMLEDGEVVETHRALGHVALDAPALVSGTLRVTARHGQARVEHAVRVAADGPAGTDTETGLGGLHDAMASGRLDGYRAGVVADELTGCPPEVAATVVAGLVDRFDHDDATALRRRVRRTLARISPDLVRQRAVRARAECRLTRWVDEPGVDCWRGSFPSEDAATAWAAIDALAQRYVTDGRYDRIDQARAKALTDLVAGHATIDVQVVLTPTVAEPGTLGHDAADLVEVTATGTPDPVLVARSALTRSRAVTSRGATDLATDAYRPTARIVEHVRVRDGHCRFPGCRIAARFCDLDHVRPWPLGATSADNLVLLCRRHHRVKQRPGWRVALDPDGTLTWTDPTGRVRTTTSRAGTTYGSLPHIPGETALPRRLPADHPESGAPFSQVEFALEHRLHGRCTRIVLEYDDLPCRHWSRRPPPVPDHPPF